MGYSQRMTLEAGTVMEFQMWAVYAFILVGLVFYVFERAAMEVTSLGIKIGRAHV